MIRVQFDCSPEWPAIEIVEYAVTAGSPREGSPVPRVAAEVAEQIAAWLDANGDADSSNPAAPEIRALVPNADGTVTIALGLLFYEAE